MREQWSMQPPRSCTPRRPGPATQGPARRRPEDGVGMQGAGAKTGTGRDAASTHHHQGQHGVGEATLGRRQEPRQRRRLHREHPPGARAAHARGAARPGARPAPAGQGEQRRGVPAVETHTAPPGPRPRPCPTGTHRARGEDRRHRADTRARRTLAPGACHRAPLARHGERTCRGTHCDHEARTAGTAREPGPELGAIAFALTMPSPIWGRKLRSTHCRPPKTQDPIVARPR